MNDKPHVAIRAFGAITLFVLKAIAAAGQLFVLGCAFGLVWVGAEFIHRILS